MATEERGRLVYQDDAGLLDLPRRSSTAAISSRMRGSPLPRCGPSPSWKLPAAAFETGIAKADWPARMQRLAQGPLAALAPPGGELWLDGGHNADGGRAIANALADLEERVSRPLVLVIGMLSSKDCDGFLKNFAGLARRIVAVPIPHQEKSLPAESIAEAGAQCRHSGGVRRGHRRGARCDGTLRARSAAAHPDHRLALSCRRSAEGERHAAELEVQRRAKTKRPTLRPAVCRISAVGDVTPRW